MQKFDIAVIGAGAGGLSFAAGASQLGSKVALIEQGKMGGDCLNYGCVPSKTLLHEAHKFAQKRKFDSEQPLNFNEIMASVNQAITTIAPEDSKERFESLGCTVINGQARFLSRNTIEVNQKVIKAKHFIIATGAKPFVPPIPGLMNTPFLTNETIFSLEKLPKHLIIIGGGPIGCELAQAFAFLGVKVSLLEAFELLPRDEADCAKIIIDSLKEAGVEIYQPIEIKKISNLDNTIHIQANHQGKPITITGSELLVATGRKANVEDLNLAAADVRFSPKGIEVNTRLQTTNKKIYAIGDVIGGAQFTHMANYQAGTALKNCLFKLPAKTEKKLIPWVTYTYPELAHIGLTSQEADKAAIDYQVIERDFSENHRAITTNNQIGKIKLLTSKKGRILGVTIVGNQAGELILPWILLMKENKSLRTLTEVMVPYPTLSEISKTAAGAFYQPKLFSPLVKKIVKWLNYI